MAAFHESRKGGGEAVSYGLVDECGAEAGSRRYSSPSEARLAAAAEGLRLDESYEGIDYWIITE